MNRQLRERLKCERTEAQDQQPLGRETGRPAEPASGLAPERSCGASPGVPRARPSEAGHLLSLAPALASFSTGMAFPILNDNEEKRLLLSGQGLASQWCKSWFKSKADDHGQRRASRLPQTANSPRLCCLSFHSGRGSPTLVRASRFTRPLRSLIHMLTSFFWRQPHRHTRNVRQLPGRPTALSR